MNGSVRQIGSGYNVTIDVGIDEITGKRIQRRKSGFKTKVAAQEYIDEIRNQLDDGINITRSPLFDEFCKEFIEIEGPKLAPKTLLSYNLHIDKYFVPYFKKIKLINIKPTLIEKYLNKLRTEVLLKKKLSDTSINYHFRILKRIFNQALKWKYIKFNPCSSVEAPKRSRDAKALWTLIELTEALPKLLESPIYSHVFLAIKTGMRIGEICALKWSDIDLIQGIITVRNNVQLIQNKLVFKDTKTVKSNREIYIDNETVKYLKSLKITHNTNQLYFGENRNKTYDEYLSIWPDGHFMDPDYVGKRFSKDLVKYDLKKTRFHDLRHLHATLLLAAGNDIKIISERLGHADISTTGNIYTHVDIELQKKAMAKLSKLVNAAK